MKRIAVFARRPEPGRVKTRLSPALPPALACDLYRAMLADALAAAAEAGAGERALYWADPPAAAYLPKAGAAEARRAEEEIGLAPDVFTTRTQSGAHLGERLERAFAELWRIPGDRAAIIGADCPDLDGAILRSAFEALAHHDLVLGPTRDGGYYLIALSQPAPSLFHDIAWSTERVLAETMDRAAALGIATRMLETLDDLDTPADLARWIGTLVGGRRTEARHTLEALKTMGLVPPAAAAQD